MLHEFYRSGSRAPAYNSIVASGENACILHYDVNDAEINEGDLVLIDAGCEYAYYASDITRTFPASGSFSKEQRAIYDIVLRANLAAIDKVRPGVTYNVPHEASVKIITAGLIKLGLIKETLAQAIKQERYRDFFMHKVGHWLGLDVHDVGDYRIDGDWRLLEPGMVTTIEPGIYIAPDNRKVAKKWRGIGVRIEDDVLVTKNEPKVLSKNAPKEVDEIESLMAQAIH
jgi:Xaa-Pro aminopeptidase